MTAYSSPDLDVLQGKGTFDTKLLSLLDPNRVPKHVAIIMDGNRRWAKQKGLPPIVGHWEGAEVLTEVVRSAADMGIKTLTVYSFSTENWGRPGSEIDSLMNIFELYLIRKRDLMIREKIRLDAIGDLSHLPDRVKIAFNETRQATQGGDRINLVLALNYGSRDEIRRAIVKILQENQGKKIDYDSITEEYISGYLDTTPWGDPEFLIRTSGEVRLSNFLLWQLSYAELYVTDVLWPDFSPKNLYEAVLSYQQRTRRLGN